MSPTRGKTCKRQWRKEGPSGRPKVDMQSAKRATCMPVGPEARKTEATDAGADATKEELRPDNSRARASSPASAESCAETVSARGEEHNVSTHARNSSSKKSDGVASTSADAAARAACAKRASDLESPNSGGRPRATTAGSPRGVGRTTSPGPTRREGFGRDGPAGGPKVSVKSGGDGGVAEPPPPTPPGGGSRFPTEAPTPAERAGPSRKTAQRKEGGVRPGATPCPGPGYRPRHNGGHRKPGERNGRPRAQEGPAQEERTERKR